MRNKRDFIRQQRRVFLEDKACYCCGTKHNLTKHHIVPLKLGGLDLEENMCKLCKDCHAKVHSHHNLNPNERYMKERLEKIKIKHQEAIPCSA